MPSLKIKILIYIIAHQLNNLENHYKQNLCATTMFLLQLTKIARRQGFKKLSKQLYTMHLGNEDIENKIR